MKNNLVEGLVARYRELIVYCIIGCTGALLDFAIYSVLVYGYGIYYQFSNFLSVSLGILNNFFLNRYFNFKTKDRIMVRLVCFYLIGMVGWALSAGLLWIFVEYLHIHSLLAKLGTIVFVTVVQFCLNKFITFRKGR